MKKLLVYIIESKIITAKQIPYNQVANEICPGQTAVSLTKFGNSLFQERKDAKKVQSKSPLYNICAKWLDDPPSQSYLGNEEKKNDKLNYANEILEIKNSILKGA